MQVAPMRVIAIDQPSSKVTKTIRVDAGFRPAVAMLFNWKNGGTPAIAIDGLTGPTGGMNIATGGQVGNNGISFWEQGILIGTNAAFNEDSGKIVCLLFRDFGNATGVASRSSTTGRLTASETILETFDLSTASTTKDQYGAGDQYGGGTDTSEGQTNQGDGETNALAAIGRGSNVVVTLDP